MNGLKVVKALITCYLFAVLGMDGVQAQYDFCSVAPTGQMLYFQWHPGTQDVSVTHPEKEWPYYAGNKPVGDLEIPDSVQHDGVVYKVVGVGKNAFYRCDSLKSFSGKGIFYVGTQSFCGCTMLETIAFDDSLRRVGEGAFAYCGQLTKLVLPTGVGSIGISAFSMCGGLEEVWLPVEVEKLCDAMTFYGCSLMHERKNRKIESVDGVEYAVWKR